MKIFIRGGYLLKYLIIINVCLLFTNLTVIYLKQVSESSLVLRLFNLFYFDNENNIPTYYSSLALFICAILLFMLFLYSRQSHKLKDKNYWKLLSVVFLFLSVDEAASIHENLTNIIRRTLNTSGYMYYAWVIPYFIFSLFIGGYCLRFLNRLPKKTKLLFVSAGVIFISGAVAFESFGGMVFSLDGNSETSLYYTLVTLEETFEMVGITVFIYALIHYMKKTVGEISIKIV